MEDQTKNDKFWFLMVPMHCSKDIHVCGRCKLQYSDLKMFLLHKKALCTADLEDKSVDYDRQVNQFDGRQFPYISCSDKLDTKFLGKADATLEKDDEATIILPETTTKTNGLLDKHLWINRDKTFTDTSEDVFSGTKSSISHDSLLRPDYKRSFKNDEEDIAALLANQLSSQESHMSSADEFNVEEVLYPDKNQLLKDDFHPTSPVKQQSTVNVNVNRELHINTAPPKSESFVKEKSPLRNIRKQYCCGVIRCSYATAMKKDLVRHARVHTGERPFKCDICPKAFTRGDKLLLHQRMHAGDKKYKCVKCDYAAVDSGSLVKHLRVHSDERPYKCQLCSYRSRDNSQLTVHLRSHTGDTPYICTKDKCKAAFKTTSDLKRHMIVHTGQKPHVCNLCDYKCTFQRNLRLHIQSQHPNGEFKEYKCKLCPLFILPTIRKLKNHLKQYHQVEWNNGNYTEQERNETDSIVENTDKNNDTIANNNNNLKLYTKYEKKKRRSKTNNKDVVVVGVMNKPFSCRLCDMSFVCEDSLHLHLRYHSKLNTGNNLTFTEPTVAIENQENMNQSERLSDNFTNNLEEPKHFSDTIVLNDKDYHYFMSNTLTQEPLDDSLKNAEILASLNQLTSREIF